MRLAYHPLTLQTSGHVPLLPLLSVITVPSLSAERPATGPSPLQMGGLRDGDGEVVSS